MLINNFTEKDVVVEYTDKQKEIIKANRQICYDSTIETSLKFYFDDEHTLFKKKGYIVAFLNLQVGLVLHLCANKDTVINIYGRNANVFEYKITCMDAEIKNTTHCEKDFCVDLNGIDELIEKKVKYDKKCSYIHDLIFVAIESIIPIIVLFKLFSSFDIAFIAITLVSFVLGFSFVLSINLLYTYFQNKRKRREVQKNIIKICSSDYLRKLI